MTPDLLLLDILADFALAAGVTLLVVALALAPVLLRQPKRGRSTDR